MPTFTPFRSLSCRSGGWLAALLLLLTSPAAFAQLSGAYTINSAQPTAGTNYASFTAAAAALTGSGVSGPVTFAVSGGPYTEQISLGTITGSGAASRVTFNGGGSVIQFGSANAAQRAVITLSGADFVTINNLVVDATVGGTSTATYGWGIQLLNNSENNVISNCTVTAALTGTTTNFAGIVSNASTTSPTTTGSTASQNLTLQNNTVTGGYYGITVVGSGIAGAPTPGVQITGNTITNCYDAGIYIGYLGGAQVTGNDVSRPTRTGASSFYGLNMNVGTTGSTVAKNRFHQAFPAGTTTTSGAYGIYLFTLAAATATSPNVIANNLIYDMSGSAVYGIFNGSSDNCKYYYNTIDINDQANIGTGGGFGFYQTTGLNVEFRNNIVRLSRTGTGLNYALLLSSIVPSFVSNNNDLTGSGSTYRTGFFQTSPYATLADWSTANGGTFDQNSVSVDPQFVSVSTGNLRPTAVALNGIAAPLASVTDDFSGATRSSTAPDPGAYEFTPPANTASISLRSIDSPAPPLALGARTVTVTIANNGTAPLSSVQLQYMFNGAASISQTLTPTGGLAVGATQGFSFTVPITLISGRNALTVTASVPNGSATMSSSLSRTFYTPLVGTYTINQQAAGSATNFTGFAEAAITLNNAGIAGPVRLNVLNGPYQERFSLDQVAGVSATDTIVVDGGIAKQRLVYSGPQMAQPGAVLLNGTDYLTLQNLTIDLASSAQYGIGVSLVGQALNNRIKNCTILASSASTLTTVNAGIAASGSVSSTTAGGDVSGLRIENDSISGGAYGITLTGISTTSRSTNVRITGTVVRNFFNYGIYLANYSGARVIGNNIHRETRVATSTFWGIYALGCVGLAIERNRIHDPNTASNSALPAHGIYFASSSGTVGAENDVVNNLIYNFSSFGTAYGLYNSGSSFARYYHNTIVMDNPSPAQTAIMGFYQTGAATDIDFRNNLVIVTQPATQGRYALNFATATSGIVSNYNDLYVGPAVDGFTGRYGTTSYATLTDWRTANASFDQNSVQTAVLFPTTGSWQPGTATLNGAGTPATLARVPRDFASVLRNNPPDIGAYEFDVLANDVDLVSIDAPVSPALLGSNPVTVTIRNGGNSPLTSVTLSYVLNGGTPVTQVFTGLTLAFNAAQQLTFTQGVTLPFGTHTIAVTASLPNGQPDANPANNTRTITVQQLIPTNDEPCGALALGAALLTGTTTAATTTVQSGIVTPACSSASLPKDVWFTLVPSGTSTTLTITGAAAGLVRLFTAPSCSAGPFTQVFCASSGASNTAFAAPIVVTGLTAGTRYYVAVSGYGSNDTRGTFTIGATAVLATLTSNNATLSVFPNPSATGQLTLRMAASSGTGSVALLNSLGQLVRQQVLSVAPEQQVSTQGLAAGLYTLRVQVGGEIITRKVVLQ